MHARCDRGEQLHRLVISLQPEIERILTRYAVPLPEAEAILTAVFDRLAVDYERWEPSARRVLFHLETRCRTWAERASDPPEPADPLAPADPGDPQAPEEPSR